MRLKFILLFAAIVSLVHAVPAMHRWKTIVQSDGSSLKVMLVGDEHIHYYITSDTVPLIEKNGSYYYANEIGYGMKATSLLAHALGNRKVAEQSRVNGIKRSKGINLHLSKTMPSALISSSGQTMNVKVMGSQLIRATSSSLASSYVGTKKGLVILVQFSDKKFTASDPKNIFTNILNEKGYMSPSPFNTVGSVHDYFSDQSYGKFDLVFDVFGPVTLSNNYAYYGQNDANGNDLYPGRMVVEACKAVLDSANVDLSDYDWNDDGIVDQVFVLYAGQGEASGGAANTIWPHEYNLYSSSYYDANGTWSYVKGKISYHAPSLGKTENGSSTTSKYNYLVYQINPKSPTGYEIFNTYACSNEVYVDGRTSYLMGIGIICHEFSHCLGFPDMYDKIGNGYGMGYFDLMDAGCYNGPEMLGWKPSGYTSYERHEAGWLDYSKLNDNDSIEAVLPISTSGAKAYKIVNPNHKNEYYLLENRQKSGWDTYIPSAGLQVTHVDYDSLIWNANIVNTKDSIVSDGVTISNDHERFTILHADNSAILRCYSNVVSVDEQGDLYPYITDSIKNDSITDYGMPCDSLYNVNIDSTSFLHASILHIIQNDDGTVSFQYNPRKINEDTNDIIGITTGKNDEIIGIYDLNGRLISLSNTIKSLPKGLYILKRKNGKDQKIIVY